jgi:hypothetical protein
MMIKDGATAAQLSITISYYMYTIMGNALSV